LRSGAWGQPVESSRRSRHRQQIQAAQEGIEEQDDDNPVIIAEAETPVHEMVASDAVMQMDLSDRAFVVFRNGSHGEFNVLYRRDDGNIGWMDPAGGSRGGAVTQPNAEKARKRR
jgi:hypothetical protein